MTTESFHVSSSRDSNRFHPSTHPNSGLKQGTLARHTAQSVTTWMSQLSLTRTKLRFWRVCQQASTTTELITLLFNILLCFTSLSIFVCSVNHCVSSVSNLSYYITVTHNSAHFTSTSTSHARTYFN